MRKRILVVTNGLPFPLHGGTKMRNGEIIRSLARDFSVHVLSLTWQSELHRLEESRRRCDSIDVVVGTRNDREMWRTAFRGLLERRPLAVAPFFFAEMADKIRAFLSGGGADIVLFGESLTAPYLSALPPGSVDKTVIDFHNIASSQHRSMTRMRLGWTERIASLGRSFLMRNWERRYARQVDCCMTVSEGDAAWLRERAPQTRVEVVRNGICPSTVLGEPSGRNTLLFVGTIGYRPNADAMLFFCERILPLIRKQIAAVKLYIVGVAPPPDVVALEALHEVVVTGEVDDLLPYYREAQVVIVPLRAGGGTRLKILEAMALGRPVVSTSVGCEGLAVTDGEHLMIADHPSDFAKKVVALLTNPAEGEGLCHRARRMVERHHDSNVIGEQVLDLFRRL